MEPFNSKFLLVFMWLFVIAKRQTVFENKLNPVKQQTAEVNRRTWKTLHQCSDNETAARVNPAGHLQGAVRVKECDNAPKTSLQWFMSSFCTSAKVVLEF